MHEEVVRGQRMTGGSVLRMTGQCAEDAEDEAGSVMRRTV